MHPKPKILEIEFGEVFAVDRERIEIVLLEIATEVASLLVFPPEKTGCEQDERGDDRRDYIDGDVAAESFEHMPSEGRASSGLLKALSAQRQWGASSHAAPASSFGEQKHEPRDREGVSPVRVGLTVSDGLGYTLRKVKRLLAVSHNRSRKRRC